MSDRLTLKLFLAISAGCSVPKKWTPSTNVSVLIIRSLLAFCLKTAASSFKFLPIFPVRGLKYLFI